MRAIPELKEALAEYKPEGGFKEAALTRELGKLYTSLERGEDAVTPVEFVQFLRSGWSLFAEQGGGGGYKQQVIIISQSDGSIHASLKLNHEKATSPLLDLLSLTWFRAFSSPYTWLWLTGCRGVLPDGDPDPVLSIEGSCQVPDFAGEKVQHDRCFVRAGV